MERRLGKNRLTEIRLAEVCVLKLTCSKFADSHRAFVELRISRITAFDQNVSPVAFDRFQSCQPALNQFDARGPISPEDSV